jgi:ribosomal protein S18 acetylase RimI-like enzyme
MAQVAEIEAHTLAREIEERSLNAWPALRRIFLDGWIVGLSEGYTWRANSVNTIYDGIWDLADKIPLCEETYASHALPTVFKVTPIAVDKGLDALLEVRGYEKQATTQVQILTLNVASDLPESDVEILEDINPEWLADYSRLKQMTASECESVQTILDRIGLPRRFVSIVENGQRVASGIAVIESGWAGMFGIVTDPAMRRRGYGRRLTQALADSGQRAGARTAYLQVEADNQAAHSVYALLGFQDVYCYWYREKP